MSQSQRNRKLSHPPPTPAELKILQYIWEHGPSTVRQVYLGQFDPAETAYTTVLKQMQIMHEKGILQRDSKARAHVYSPVLDKETVQRGMLRDFVSRVYQGSAKSLVLQALGNGPPARREEIEEIRRFLDELDPQAGPGAKR